MKLPFAEGSPRTVECRAGANQTAGFQGRRHSRSLVKSRLFTEVRGASPACQSGPATALKTLQPQTVAGMPSGAGLTLLCRPQGQGIACIIYPHDLTGDGHHQYNSVDWKGSCSMSHDELADPVTRHTNFRPGQLDCNTPCTALERSRRFCRGQASSRRRSLRKVSSALRKRLPAHPNLDSVHQLLPGARKAVSATPGLCAFPRLTGKVRDLLVVF